MAEANEFLAEETVVRIIPNFQHDALRFVTGNFGPFVPQTPVDVPLWLVCILRKRRMCTVVRPKWLHADALSEKSDDEANNSDVFSTMPNHYHEVAALLIEAGGEDLVEQESAKSIFDLHESIEDISRHRLKKLRQGMLAVARQSFHDETTYSIKMSNVSGMEVSSIRQQLLLSLNTFYHARARSTLFAAHDKRRKRNAQSETEVAKRTLKRFK